MKHSMVPVDLQFLKGNLGSHHLYSSLRSEIDDLFHNFFGRADTQMLSSKKSQLPLDESTENIFFFPDIDVVENDDALMLTAELPGLNKDDIDINFNDGTLTIRGEKRVEHDEDVKDSHITERRFGKFVRSYTLPRAIDADAIKAEMKDGVLMVTVPKIEDNVTKAHRIVIK